MMAFHEAPCVCRGATGRPGGPAPRAETRPGRAEPAHAPPTAGPGDPGRVLNERSTASARRNPSLPRAMKAFYRRQRCTTTRWPPTGPPRRAAGVRGRDQTNAHAAALPLGARTSWSGRHGADLPGSVVDPSVSWVAARDDRRHPGGTTPLLPAAVFTPPRQAGRLCDTATRATRP